MARVLVVDDDPASRLTLQTLLQAGGYSVDSAASAAEAVGKLDEAQYDLVLSDVGMESPDSGYRVIAYARHLEYRPATALITTHRSTASSKALRSSHAALVEPQDVEGLLDQVAALISERATRRMRRLHRVS
jgi:CheY-like chemotaxis protein